MSCAEVFVYNIYHEDHLSYKLQNTDLQVYFSILSGLSFLRYHYISC